MKSAADRSATEVRPRPVHLVHFYEHDEELIGGVAHYFAQGIGAGGTGILIATPEHAEASVAAAGVTEGSVLSLDASETLARFMVDGSPDPSAFDATVGSLVRSTAASGNGLYAYGEMVALLWESGNLAGALELETLWNELISSVGFSLYCAYPSAILGDDQAEVASICRLHSEVVGAATPGAPSGATRLLFPYGKDSPRAARHAAVRSMHRWGRAELSGDAAIIVTELASNAIVHGRSDFRMTIATRGDVVRIEIEDTGTALLPYSGASEENHNGLLLVNSLSRRWGSEPTETGKIVWAEISRASE